MKMFFAFSCLILAFADEMLITKEYVEDLKKTVSWDVMEYEDNIFKGWTLEEGKNFLGGMIPQETTHIPSIEIAKNLPARINWAHTGCDFPILNQGQCGSCWAVATTDMLSSRCCLQGHDHGFLSIQELVSCDKVSKGCSGGWCTWALDYVIKNQGLVPETCFPYQAKNLPCPSKCVDGSDFKAQHVCNCLGGYKKCLTVDGMRTCLLSGPLTAMMGMCRSGFNYKSGIFTCDCGGGYVGLHTILILGYSDTPKPNFYAKNSWGTGWGMQGYLQIGADQCGVYGKYENGNLMCEKVGS